VFRSLIAQSGSKIVKPVLILLFGLFFPLSVTASAWAECFRHSHAAVDELHHHGGASDFMQHADSEYDHSAPRVHCPHLRFASLASLSAKSDPKLRDHEYRLASLLVSIEQTALNVQNGAIKSAGRFPSYSFLVGLSPHLLLSVFRI
jgi:hypothetical protein